MASEPPFSSRPRTLPALSPFRPFAESWVRKLGAIYGACRTRAHPRRRRGQWTGLSWPVRVQPVFIPLHAQAYQPAILGQPSPFRVFGPETRSRPPSHAAQLMVEYFLAIANSLLPQSTSSSRSFLALHTLMPRLRLSSASPQPDLSRVQHSNGKGKAVLGDDHGSFERPDWLHIAHHEPS